MQLSLMHETINDALREAVQACGGFKKVGHLMWPEMPADHAAGKLRDCLNPDRREHLTPEQVSFLLGLSRRAGCHTVASFLMHEAGYATPQPVEPEDVLARQQHEFVEATKTLQRLAAQIADTQTRVDQHQKIRAV